MNYGPHDEARMYPITLNTRSDFEQCAFSDLILARL